MSTTLTKSAFKPIIHGLDSVTTMNTTSNTLIIHHLAPKTPWLVNIAVGCPCVAIKVEVP